MPLVKEVSLGPGKIVLDGDRPPRRKRGTSGPSSFWPMSIVATVAHLSYYNIHQHASKTANITKDDISSQHSNILAMCCDVIYSFVILASLDMRAGRCRP